MAPKKKGGSPKGKKRSSSSKAKVDEALAEPDPIVLPTPVIVPWVTMSLRLVTWSYLNFSKRVPLSLRLTDVCEIIAARHGGSVSALDVRLYKDEVSTSSQLHNMMATLEDLDGPAGAPAADGASTNRRRSSMQTAEAGGHRRQSSVLNSSGEWTAPAIEVVLFYDFKSMASECPLLLAEPPNYRFAREQRAAAQAAAKDEEERRAREEQRAQKLRGASSSGGSSQVAPGPSGSSFSPDSRVASGAGTTSFRRRGQDSAAATPLSATAPDDKFM